jgi:RNA polymerase-binding transcription factor DksA
MARPLPRIELKLPRVRAPKLKRPARNGATPGGAQTPKPVNRELLAERDRLLEKFTVMQADLGGAFYEMAIRDHVKLDVLTRKAAELQRVDIELGQVEEQLQQVDSASIGQCASCGAPFEHGARFCSHCGHELAKG